MNRRSWLKLSAAFGAAMFAMSGAQAQDTIKIGEMNSYKNFAAFLEPYKKGWELAVEQANASGGALGKKIEIVSRDDNGNPALRRFLGFIKTRYALSFDLSQIFQ